MDQNIPNLNEPANILLVDDDNVIRMLIQRILEQVGHVVTCVADGEQAIAVFKPHAYDLLITDVVMPNTGGFELLAHIKDLDPEIEVIMITGAPTTQLALDAMRDEQVADFIVKPFDHTTLRQSVTRVLKQRRMRQYNRQLSDELNRTLDRQASQILLLSETVRVQSRISASLNEIEVLKIAVDESCRLFACDWAMALIMTEDNGLSIEVATSPDRDLSHLISTQLPVALNPFSISGEEEDQSLARVMSLEPGDPLADFFNVSESTSLIFAPLILSDRMYGALLLAYDAPRVFNDDQLIAVNLLVQQLVVAIINAELHADMHMLATRDPLTGLLNRRELLKQAEKALKEVAPTETSLAVLMLDIDNFKGVNDTFGHVAGDAVIKMIGETAWRSVRQFDMVGRYGGEEFMIVLTNAPSEVSVRVANRIWENIGSEIVNWENDKIKVTASIGVAISTPESRLSLNRLIVAADEALYRAKQTGRNRIVLAWDKD